jgi:hypothetical protein
MKIPKRKDMQYLGQEVYTDGLLAYKFFKSYHERHPENEAEALIRVQDIQGVQKFIDYDNKREILITKLAKGHLLDEKSEEFKTGILNYTQNQLKRLFKTLVGMKEKGIVFETHAKNLFYDISKGFTPIDYCIPTEARINLRGLLNILSLRGVPVKEQDNPTRFMHGLNKQNHPDLRLMVYKAFKSVNQKHAKEEIDRFEELERSLQSFTNELNPNKTIYKTNF